MPPAPLPVEPTILPSRLALLLLLAALGCDSGSDADDTPDLLRIPGIDMLDDMGQPLGIYGSPDFSATTTDALACSGGGTGNLTLAGLLPNPTRDAASFDFLLSCAASLHIWMERGLGPEESRQGWTAQTVEVTSEAFGEGSYRIQLSTSIMDPLPDGFYRIYVEGGGQKLWRDLWISRD